MGNLPELLKKLVFGTGAGIGVMVAYIVFDAVHAKPELALQVFGQLMSGPGALVFVLIGGMYFGNQRVGEGLQVLRDNTAAQRDLASAVQSLAARDDREAEEQRRLMSYLGAQMEKVAGEISELRKERARGANA